MAEGILASMSVRLGADISEFQTKMRQAQRDFGGLVKAGEQMRSVGTALSTFVTLPLLGVGAASLKMAADMEQAEVAFTTMLGSAGKAKTLLKELNTFAAKTPFEFPEIQGAAKKLLAFGVTAKQMIPTLTAIGDISAGIGAPLGEIAEIYGKARVQGRLFAEDINQLTGRGIPIIQELAKQFGVAEVEVKKLVESGKVNFKNLEKAFQDLTKEGGKFGGLMDAQSRTMAGLWSSAKDSIGQSLAELGRAIDETFDIKGLIKSVADSVGSLTEKFRSLSPEGQKTVVVVATLVAAIGPLLVIIGTLGAAIPAIVAGFTALKLAITGVGASVGILVVGIAAAVAALYAIGKAMEVSSARADSATAAFKTQQQALADLKKNLDPATKGYDDLLAAQKRVTDAAQNKALAEQNRLLHINNGAIQEAQNLLKTGGRFRFDNRGGQSFDPLTQEERDANLKRIADLNLRNKAIQDQINLIKGVTKVKAEEAEVEEPAAAKAVAGSDAKAKALAALRKELQLNQTLSKGLGDSYAYVDERRSILESGLKSLMAAGFAPMGKTVQTFKKELASLPQAFDLLKPTFENTLPTWSGFLKSFAENGRYVVTDIVAGFNNLVGSVEKVNTTMATGTPYLNEYDAGLGQLHTSLAGLAEAFAENTIVYAAENLGQALTGSFQGMEGFFNGFLGMVGDFLGQYGQMLIQAGIAKTAFEKMLAAPGGGIAAVAAGVALVAISGAIKGKLKKGPSYGGGGSSGGGKGSPPAGASYAAVGNATGSKVEFVIKGTDLVGVLSKEQKQMVRRG